MLKVKRAGLGFPALFFCAVVWLVTPNNCSFQQVTALSPAHLHSVEQLFTQEAGQQVAGSPDPEAPRTIVRYPDPDKPDPDPIHRGFTCLKPNNSPITPRSSPISSRSEQLFGLRSHTLSK